MAHPSMVSCPAIKHALERLQHEANHTEEDGCKSVWDHICREYLPTRPAGQHGRAYSVMREAPRGPEDDPQQHVPDIVAKRLYPQNNSADEARDALWVECKAAVHDKPSGWKNLFSEAADRLEDAHEGRKVFVIAAVGRKAIPLAWDPNDHQAPQLSIRAAKGGKVWDLDPGFVPGPAGPWINVNTGRLDINGALELCTPSGPEYWQIQPNIADMQVIQDFFGDVKAAQLLGRNPEHWN